MSNELWTLDVGRLFFNKLCFVDVLLVPDTMHCFDEQFLDSWFAGTAAMVLLVAGSQWLHTWRQVRRLFTSPYSIAGYSIEMIRARSMFQHGSLTNKDCTCTVYELCLLSSFFHHCKQAPYFGLLCHTLTTESSF